MQLSGPEEIRSKSQQPAVSQRGNMRTKHSPRLRTLVIVSSITLVLFMIAWSASAILLKTSLWEAVPAVAAYLDPDRDGATTTWMILAGMLAVMLIGYLTTNHFGRKRS